MFSVRPEARVAASAGSKGTNLPLCEKEEKEKERERERADERELGGELSRCRPSPKSVSRGDEPEMAANARKRLTITSLTARGGLADRFAAR